MTLPLNMRFKVMRPEDAMGMPTLMMAMPLDPDNPMKIATQPCRLEIQLQDPDTGQPVWIEVPFAVPQISVLEVHPYKRKQ